MPTIPCLVLAGADAVRRRAHDDLLRVLGVWESVEVLLGRKPVKMSEGERERESERDFMVCFFYEVN